MDPSFCDAVRAALYVDPEGKHIDEDMQRAVERHLKECAACQEAHKKGVYSV